MQSVPTAAQNRLSSHKAIKRLRLETSNVSTAYPNIPFPPTDNLKVRQAIMAALDMNELMEAA